jgi:hypothetical protein
MITEAVRLHTSSDIHDRLNEGSTSGKIMRRWGETMNVRAKNLPQQSDVPSTDRRRPKT